MNIMKERSLVLLPRLQSILETVGENLKLARLRRKLTVIQVAQRAGITRTTLWQIERGAAHVSMAAYAQVLLVLGLEKDLLKLSADDEMGKRIQDSGLIVKQRGPKR
jgi:transcriptional regulator with XRE-family HTH domain